MTEPQVLSGQVCQTCQRRVPYPRTESSPVSRTVSIRVPADDHESYTQALEDAAGREPIVGLKYPRAVALELGLAVLLDLDDDILRGIVAERYGEQG